MEKSHLFVCLDNWEEDTRVFLMEICRGAERCGIGQLYLHFNVFSNDAWKENSQDLRDLIDTFAGVFSEWGITLIYDTSIIHQIDFAESWHYARSKGMELCTGDIARFRVGKEEFALISGFGCLEEAYEWDGESGNDGCDPQLAAEDAERYFLESIQKSGTCPRVIPSENGTMFQERYEKILRGYSQLLLFPEPICRNKAVVGPVLVWKDGWQICQLQRENGLFSLTEPEK